MPQGTEMESGSMSQQEPERHRHRISKYGKNWYGDCGICMRSVWNQHWSATRDLLTLHVQDHQPLTGDQVSS